MVRAGAGAGADKGNEGSDVIVIDADSPTTNQFISDIIQFTGEELGDVQLRQTILADAMANQLNKNASARILSFSPSYLEGLLQMLINVRGPLLTIALQADDGAGELHNALALALPNRLTKQVKKVKMNKVKMLVRVFFVIDQIIRSGVELPGRHSAVSKALAEFCTPLVRVRNYCLHQLADESTQKRALKSEKVTGEFCFFEPHLCSTVASHAFLLMCQRGRATRALDRQGPQEPWCVQHVRLVWTQLHPLAQEGSDRF